MKRLLSLTALLLLAVVSFAHDFEVDGIYYNITSSSSTSPRVEVSYKGTSYYSLNNEYAGNVTIPKTVTYSGKTYSVTSIGSSAFRDCSGLTSVTIPNSVTSIDNYAFEYCTGLTSITIPNSVTSIGKSAFDNTYLKSVTIGTGVLSIGSSAFPYNTSSSGSRPVKVIWLTNTPPDGYKNAEGTVNYVANNLYTSLSNKTVYPFLSSMFEVDGVKYVPVSPSERTCDAIDCMYNESAENITISQTVQNQGISFTLKEIKPYVFNRNPYIRNVTIESNYTGDIPSYAFSGCSNLQGVIIPDAVTNIGQSSFSGCSKMTFVKIGSGVTSIPTYAFSGCSALNDMQIGQNVQTIDEYAFYICRALKSITIPKSVTNINNNVFDNCSGLKKVIMEDRTDDTMLLLGYNYFFSSDKQPLFSSCPLDEVYIGRNISYNTSSSYGYSPFYRNTSLRSVTITDRETEISDNEFYGCTNLKEVRIGDGVTTIGNRAFSGCSSLDYFAFGSAVRTIGQEAFSDCTAMTKLISKAATPPTCGSQALDDINKWTCKLYVPTESLSQYQQADQWKEFFFIEAGIKSISGSNSNKATIKSRYDLGGKQLSQPQRGLNILRMSDGTTRKIVK